MNTKHTPGPWWLAEYSTGSEIYGFVDGKDSSTIAAIMTHRHDTRERKANARLIVAAPDMLKALQSIVEYGQKYSCDGEGDGADWFKLARAAIAKAIDAN